MDRRSFCRIALGWLAVVNSASPMHAKAEPEDPLTIPIRRAPVESSSIASVGFQENFRVLEIEFRSGALYRYFSVPAGVFDEFQKAGSKGRFFSQRIRGRYRFHRLEDVKP